MRGSKSYADEEWHQENAELSTQMPVPGRPGEPTFSTLSPQLAPNAKTAVPQLGKLGYAHAIRRPIMQREAAMVLAVLVVGIVAAPAQTPNTAPAKNVCFPINQMQDWKAPDYKTIYIRVNMSQYYRLDLAGTCAMLTMPDSHLITRSRGSDLICSAIDWDLSVSEPPPGAIPEACIVRQMTLLTPQEVSAIPAKFKP
jgi:hypothetical protein